MADTAHPQHHLALNPDDPKGLLVKGLGLVDATALVIGSMIGSGIFIVPAAIAREVQSPGLLLMTWVVTAVLTLIAALSYGELAAAMPHAGGQYVYLREAFGRLPSFLYGWTLFFVIQTGTIAAVAVAFAKFTGVFFPFFASSNYLLQIGAFGINTQQMLAITILLLLTWVNTRGVRTGALIQNVFTAGKILSLLLLIGMGFIYGQDTDAVSQNFRDFWRNANWNWDTVKLVGVAMVGALFSSDAWNNVTFTAGEVRNPKRNLPLSLAAGVLTVSFLYLFCNFTYLRVLSLDQIAGAPEDRVATAAVEMMLGPVAQQIMAAAIMVSTFGCLNGIILAGARVYYAMALDGLFLRRVAKLDERTGVPVTSLWFQCGWASLLCLSGRYNDLLDYVIFAVLLFYILTIAGLFVLRSKRPDMPRPYKAIGYPVLPALYILLAALIELLLLAYKPSYTWPGLIIVLLGVPVYYYVRQKREVE